MAMYYIMLLSKNLARLLVLICVPIIANAVTPVAPGGGPPIPIHPLKPGMPPTPNQPHNPGDGIRSHQVYSANSKDGKNWILDGKLLFDHASVPDAVIDSKGTIYLYFMDASNHQHQMSVAVSRDSGKSFEKKKVEIANRQTDGQAVDPNPVLLDDGRIRLYYFGTFGPPKPNEPDHTINSAISSDGIHFTEEAGVRFAAPHITDPDVIKVEGGWKMFVSQGRLNLSTSSKDGLTFIQDKNPASTTGAVSRTIAIDGGYRMFTCGHGIEMQYTKDFVTWRMEGTAIEPAPGYVVCDPGIIKLPHGTWIMYYKQVPMNKMH